MSLKTQWEVLGEKRGTHRALAGTVLRQLRLRVGEVATDLEQAIDSLSDDTLGNLSEALLDFGSMAEAQAWVARQAPASRE